jgi:aerobic carbon-monoxide dehydrogenase medium subunit
MYPPPFHYEAPDTLEEAIALKAQYGDEGKILAGGMSLIPLMKLRFASPEAIIDINRIQGLDNLSEGSDGSLQVGALVRHRTIVRSDVVRSNFPCASVCAPLVADPIVRNRGTFVGSVCHADPQGDFGAVMMAMGGEIVAQGPNGRRTIPIDQFIVGPFQNSLNDDEIAVEARIPRPGGRAAGTYLKLERKVGDFATAGVAISLGFDGSTVSKAGIALTGVGSQNINANSAAQGLVGSSLSQSNIQEAARQAASMAEPKSDHRGSADYKREIIRVFTVRGLSQAAGMRA